MENKETEKKAKRFHITITDLEENTVEVDCDTDAIIGAYNYGERKTGTILFTSCNTIEMVTTIKGANLMAEKAKEQVPSYDLIASMLGTRVHKKEGVEKE